MNCGSFAFHPEFASWIDKESVRIAGLVKDLTHRAPARTALPKERDLPVAAKIGADDFMGKPLVFQTDVAGTLVMRSYPQGDRWLGLADEGMVDARRLSERIWDRPEICNRLSRQTIEELLLEWVGATI